jgi:hypothetical protein
MASHNFTLVDSALLAKNAAPEQEPESPAGSTLPPDFPKDEFSEHQLILLEELFFQYTREFILRFFSILATPVSRSGNAARQSTANIACQAVVLSKLLGLNSEIPWRNMPALFGISAPDLMAAKEHTLRMLDRMASRGAHTPGEWQALARLARKQARLFALRAAALRSPITGTRRAKH